MLTPLLPMWSRFAFGPGSIDTKMSIWLNQHEKNSLNCYETAPWVGLPARLCLSLRILFLFCRAEPKIAWFFVIFWVFLPLTPSVVLWQTWERNLYLQWSLSCCITEKMGISKVFLSSAQILGFWAVCPLSPFPAAHGTGLHSKGKMSNASLCCSRWHCQLQTKKLYISLESSSSWCKRMKGKTTKAVHLGKYERSSFSLSLCLDSFLSWLVDSKIDRWTSDLDKTRKESTERLSV